jgi:lysophospholipase L1-like esterase
MNGQVMTPVAVSALPAASSGNANLIQLVSSTANCTSSGGTNPMLCISTGSAWVPLGGGGTSGAGGGVSPANLVAEYSLGEGTGSYAYNYAYPPQPNYNLVGPSEQQFAAGNSVWQAIGITTTDDYAPDPNGDWVASRLQATSTGGYLALPSPGVLFVAGQQYTLSVYVASNTGAAQTMRMADNNVNFTANMTVPAAGWTRLSYTWTASGTGYQVMPVVQDAANDHLDILIWGVQLEIGPHPTTYIPQVYQMVNGGGPQRTASQCAWIAAGVDCTVNAGASYMTAAGWQPIDLSTATVYAAVKWTGNQVLSGYAPILSDNYNSPHLYLAGQDSSVPFPRFRFGGLFQDAYGTNLNDGNWHILVGQFTGANINLFLDGLQVATYNVGAAPAVQIAQLFLGNFANAAYWPGQIGYAALYSVAHSTAQVAANTGAIQTIMAARGVAIPALSQLLVFEGDSITDPTTGVAAQSKYYHLAQAAISPFPQGANDAVSGSSIATAISRQATVDSWFAPVTGLKVLFLFLGANDMGDGATTFEANLKAYCLARKAASPGLKIVLATLLPQTTAGFNAFRDAVNPLIHADPSFYDALADFAANPTMGCDSCAANSTYYSDGEHPSVAGHAILGPIASAAIQSVW